MKLFNAFTLAAILACSVTTFASCSSDEEELQTVEIDKTLIVGRWVNKSDAHDNWEYGRMGSDGKGTGVYWDSSEMTYEDAAAGPGKFQYYFNETGLMRIYWMEMNESYSNPDTEAPFIIDVLNSTTMTYHPSGTTRQYSFSRQ